MQNAVATQMVPLLGAALHFPWFNNTQACRMCFLPSVATNADIPPSIRQSPSADSPPSSLLRSSLAPSFLPLVPLPLSTVPNIPQPPLPPTSSSPASPSFLFPPPSPPLPPPPRPLLPLPSHYPHCSCKPMINSSSRPLAFCSSLIPAPPFFLPPSSHPPLSPLLFLSFPWLHLLFASPLPNSLPHTCPLLFPPLPTRPALPNLDQ